MSTEITHPPHDAAHEPSRRAGARATRVLVVYGSAKGATEGVAERIAARLRAAGADVDVHSAEEDREPRGVDAVVLGSGVYDGAWIPAATEYARRHAAALAERPVWLFSVGTFGDSHAVIGRLMRREPRDIGELQAAVRPREYRVFAGVIAKERWPLYGRMFLHAFGGRLGDNRDWPQIDAWADAIARELHGS